MSLSRAMLFILTLLAVAAAASSQASPQASPTSSAPAEKKQDQQPQVRMHYLNVCTPTLDEEKEIAAAMVKLPKQPPLGHDFEISRGLNTMETDSARYLRLRRDFAPGAALTTVQYTLSAGPSNVTETLVLHPRDTKEAALSFEARASAAAGPAKTMLTADTPVSRVQVERPGKQSLVLARCEGTDQAKYQPLFDAASAVMSIYRKVLKVQTQFPAEVAWVSSEKAEPGATHPAAAQESKPKRSANVPKASGDSSKKSSPK